MRVAQKFAGYSLAEADNLRKAMRQEDPRADRQGAREVRRRLRAPRATARELGEQLFDIIEPFADYAFNKCHAFGYGLVAYQTAYLKAHYPVEYLAALLTSVKANLDKAAVYLAECRQHGHPGARPRRQPRRQSDFVVRARRRRRQPRRDPRSGCRRCATSARAWSRCIVDERDDERAVRRLLRLLRARRPDGAQQAHDRVADQGRRVRLARPPPPGPAARVRARSSTRMLGRRRERGRGSVRACSRRSTIAATTAVVRRAHRRSPTSSSTRRSGSRSRRRCSGST